MPQHHHSFIERFGLQFEANGFPRIAGRIFGLLLVADEPLSLDDIAEKLEVSKASVSTDARRLAQHGIVELVSRTGDRRDYYRIGHDAFARSMRLRLESIRNFHSLLHECGKAGTDQSPVVRRRIAEFELNLREMTRVIEDGIKRCSSRNLSN